MRWCKGPGTLFGPLFEDEDDKAQRALLAKAERNEIALEDLRTRSRELFEAKLAAVGLK